MANVNIKFNGKEFLLSCEDGQEPHLEELSEQLNHKFENLKKDLGNIGENKLLLITSIKIIDEYFETKKKVEEKKKEFKELKSLVYEYRENKENEIKQLVNQQDEFKKEIERNKNDYEKIIDEAANQIETFLEKANQEDSIQ